MQCTDKHSEHQQAYFLTKFAHETTMRHKTFKIERPQIRQVRQIMKTTDLIIPNVQHLERSVTHVYCDENHHSKIRKSRFKCQRPQPVTFSIDLNKMWNVTQSTYVY